MLLSQDNAAVQGILGVIQGNDQDGAGGTFAGTTGNTVLLGNKYNGHLYLGTNNNVRMTISNAGDVAIGGATSSSYKLRVHGKVRSDGINETSDERLKKNIQTLDRALEKVLALRGVNYEWKTEEFPDFIQGTELGVIAQEVEEILPEVVHTDEDGYKSVQYSHIVPVLIEAIKEQQEMINSKKQQILLLTAKSVEQEDRIDHLENAISKINQLFGVSLNK